ncbi:MAG: VWA domain-containing protein [Actinomycetota bacterium]|nr:VWA domain-containing protein [Actinomycetota bacterium]
MVHFVRYLRASGLPLGPATAAELAEVVDVVGFGSRHDLYLALRAAVITRTAQRPVFDRAFEVFFGSGVAIGDEVVLQRPGAEGNDLHLSVPVLRPRGTPPVDGAVAEEEVAETLGGSYDERLATRDFASLDATEREDVRRLIARMVWRPADTWSRRWGPGDGTRPDMRRTLAAMHRPEGDLLPIEMSRRKRRRRPLVILADVSGSMERYTEMLLVFAHAAQGRVARVETFVFATRLTRITRDLRLREPEAALRQVGTAVPDWSGGTRIGEMLERFNRDWSRRVTGGGAIGLIISDGWDTGDAELLDREMARFARSVHRVIWLNPHAGRPGFAPETRGLRTVLPYVDDFLPSATIVDLASVVRLLESVSRHRRQGTP